MKKNLKSKSKSKMLSKKTNSKGITLIALIITIIVLLILAGVTINLTLGENGIFRTAEMAGKNYMDAQDRELAGLVDFENMIDNIIGGTGSSSGTDTPITNYKTLRSLAEAGDYVKYDTGISSVGDNGIVTFRVLYNDDTYGLQIISDKSIEIVPLAQESTDEIIQETPLVKLSTWEQGRDSYNNAIAILNQKAEYYAQSSPYALDGRCVGSVPTIGADGKFNAKNTENVGPVQLQYSSAVEGANEMKEADTNYTIDKTKMEAVGISNTGEFYWLASRDVSSGSSYCYFYVRFVPASFPLYDSSLCNVDSDGNAKGNSIEGGLRPCISLKSDIKVIAGDGKAEETAYELGI